MQNIALPEYGVFGPKALEGFEDLWRDESNKGHGKKKALSDINENVWRNIAKDAKRRYSRW